MDRGCTARRRAAAVLVGALVALAGSLALAPMPRLAGADPGQVTIPGEDTTTTPVPTSTDPTTTTAPPATTEPVPTTADPVPTTQDTVAPTTEAPPVTAAPVAPPTTARPVPTTAAPVTTTEPETITTTVDLLVPGDGTEGAQSTTTTLRRTAGEVAQGDSGLEDSTLVALVIGGLVVLALVIAALTWRYWAATRPVPAPAGEPDAPPADAARPTPQPPHDGAVGAVGDARPRAGAPDDGSDDPTDPVVSSTAG